MSVVLACSLALVGCQLSPSDTPCTTCVKPFSWQMLHAEVLPGGDLEWRPQPFRCELGRSVRYIDYENGSDDNPGTRQAPWKHHPWDLAAGGLARRGNGADTYVFKRGVIYRGELLATESGTASHPIRLTSDPQWGSGEAMLYGSLRLAGGWKRLSLAEAPASMPEPGKVWYMDLSTTVIPRSLWEVRDGQVLRIHLARDPNWTISNWDDVKSNWYAWEKTEKTTVEQGGQSRARVIGFDSRHIQVKTAGAYDGARVWSEYSGVMGTAYPSPVEAYDPETGGIRFGGPWGSNERYRPILHNRYFLENHPRFLDTGGEYWFATEGPHAGRLYVRLHGDRDPNMTAIELPTQTATIDVRDASNIEISGLTFRFGNAATVDQRWWTLPEDDHAAVRVVGNCSDIAVRNCLFEFLPQAVRMAPREMEVMDNVAVTDCIMRFTDYGPLAIYRAGGKGNRALLKRVRVMRNKVETVGLRPLRAHHGHALSIRFPQVAEIAGNMLNRTGGAGLFVFGGKGSGAPGVEPLGRILMHHNKAVDTLLMTNDWGGIESWQGGSTYIYDNVSGNPGGYWHWSHVMRGETAEERSHTTARFGFAYYLDGAFKQYVFNNIAWGRSNDLTSPLANTAALQEIIGFQNAAFHNTFYRFAAGSRRQAAQAGRNRYLSNVFEEISDVYFRHAKRVEGAREANQADADAGGRQSEGFHYPTLAYDRNVFGGSPRDFAYFEHTGAIHEDIESFRQALKDRGALAWGVGRTTDAPILVDAAGGDFRLADGSPAIDGGSKYFVPWSLYATVGEWNFYQTPGKANTVFGENWFMTEAHKGRGGYRNLPRNDLTGHNFTQEDYIQGPLENWVRGAVAFNGEDRWFSISAPVDDGSDPNTPDMGTNSFIIETCLRGRSGPVVTKADDNGYMLAIGADGHLRMTLRVGAEKVASRVSSQKVDDGQWHHVLVQVDRANRQGIHIYLDGRDVSGQWTGQMPAGEVSLSNEADLLVGRCAAGDKYFHGAMDFLRISRGTLAEAMTSLEELYAWQFKGPHLRDFAGRQVSGPRRDAGALELDR